MPLMLRNSKGRPDGIWTGLVFFSVLAALLLLVSGLKAAASWFSWAPAFSASDATALLAPWLAAYVARRRLGDAPADASGTITTPPDKGS